MPEADRLNQRILELGRDIFEWAEGGQPRIWQQTWWLEKMIQLLDCDPVLRTRAFEFVDCLPTLRTDDSLVRHMSEYFDARHVKLPTVAHAVLRPGRCRDILGGMMAWGARFGAHQMAGRFITGYDVPSVVRTIERLRQEGMAFTLDVLGEFTTSYAQADRYAQVYHDLIQQLAPISRTWPTIPGIDCDESGPMPALNFSIKVTSLDPHFDAIDPARSIRNVSARLRPLLRRARDAGALVNIDLESTKYREITFELFKQLLMEDEFRDWADVGIVAQAYLKDGERDLADLLEWGKRRGTRFAIRLVKGAYWDAETAAAVRAYKEPPVWTRKWESDACYERMTRTMFENADLIRPCFASHNVRSLAVVMATAEHLGVSPAGYEVQMLYGMGDPLKTAMVGLGRCLRVYCPYGDLMPGMGYLIRRLLENTSNEGFLQQNYLDRTTQHRLLIDPAEARPPSSPLPTRHYVNTDPEEKMSDFTNATSTSFAAEENRRKMAGAIDYVRGEFGRTYPLVIGGETSTTGDWFESANPSRSTETIGKVAMATTSDADRAVASAKEAFKSWRLTRAGDRSSLLRQVADRLEMRRFELAATMVLEVGKPWREADADVTEAIDHCRYYADQIERLELRPRLRNLPGENNMSVYLPKGVCAVISPWAFPLAILTGMTSAALAGGNTVVIKPARQASVVAAKLMEVFQDVAIPPGVVNYLPGHGEVVGRHLVEHDDVNVVAFTGSEVVGSGVIRSGAQWAEKQAFIKKMIVEMGGKNAIIVDDDADLDGAVQAVIESSFSFAGQKCSSCSRVIVLDGVYDLFLQRLREAAESVVIGPAEEPATTVGPVIDDEARQRIAEYIEIGRQEGRLLVNGPLPAGCDTGSFVAPAIFVDVPPDARIAQEEVFGPLLAVTRARDFDHAIEIANATRYALTGGVYSRSPAHLDKARRHYAVGNLYINRRITGSQVDAQPFGGFKLSGTGVKAGSPDYLTHFMDARCITENTLRSGLVPEEEHTEVSQKGLSGHGSDLG